MADHPHRALGRGLGPFLSAAAVNLDREEIRLALMVLAGYYLGARAGLALTFDPSPISVLWPPNSVMFAAMMLLNPGKWWLVAAAALPAHLVSELQSGIPLSMVLCWYVSNVAEALVGASGMRFLLGESNPFDTPRGVILFVLIAVVAAVLSSFIDCAFVALNEWRATSFWDNWSNRVLSNVTSHVVIVPAIVTWVFRRASRGLHGSAIRIDEALVLYGGLATVTLVVFNTGLVTSAPAAQVCLPIPFLLWAAFRFGTLGASISFVIVALVTIWGAGHGIGALGARSLLENQHSVQLFLLCLGPTLLCLAAAIDERRRGVESLRLSEKRFQIVLEATRDVVCEHEMATGKLWWSSTGPAHFGYSRRDDLRDFPALARIVHEEDRARWRSQQEQALEGGQLLWDAEFRLRRSDGTYCHVQEHGFIVRDSRGLPIQAISALSDITDRRVTEELSQRLSQASRLTAMGELAASIAHEINQPMSAILSNVDSAEVLLNSGRSADPEMREILHDIRSDDLRASEIIRHIRNLANKHEVEIETFDVNESVQSVVRLAMPAARRRGVTLRASCAEAPLVSCDRIHVQQVLLNLVFNGMDAMEAALPEERILLVSSSMAAAGTVRISVCDRGHGIPAAQVDKIFDSFFTTKKDGMGLGLSISRSLVLAHGGRIWAENNKDQGATVSFSLPAHRP